MVTVEVPYSSEGPFRSASRLIERPFVVCKFDVRSLNRIIPNRRVKKKEEKLAAE
jgi:hypothetical protein